MMGLFDFFKHKTKPEDEDFLSPMEGIVKELDDVPDEVFSKRVMGDGFAIEPTGSKVVAPISATVVTAFPTGHAYGLKADDGTEILIHIGIDTVQLDGKGFDVKVKAGDQVKQGDTLVEIDIETIKQAGKSVISPIIFTDGKTVEVRKKNKHVKLLQKNIVDVYDD